MNEKIAEKLKELYEEGGGQIADIFTDINIKNKEDVIAPDMVISYCIDVLNNPKNEDVLLHALYVLADIPEIQGFWDDWATEWGTKAIEHCSNKDIIPKISNYLDHTSNEVRHSASWAIYCFLDNSILFLKTDDDNLFKKGLRAYNSKFNFGEKEINQIKELVPILQGIKKKEKYTKNIDVINDILQRLNKWESEKT